VPGPPGRPRIFRTNFTSMLGRGLTVEQQVEDRPQRAKRNLTLRACCRRPAWTKKHRQKVCFLPLFSAKIHDARDFRTPQIVDDRHHHLRWNNFHRDICFGEHRESTALQSCVRSRQRVGQPQSPLLHLDQTNHRCLYKMDVSVASGCQPRVTIMSRKHEL
jgi:hypothetical protein